jgi:hypothetical protein
VFLSGVPSHQKLGQAGELILMDYVIAALNGFNGDYYVPGSFNCTNNTRWFQVDAMRTITNYRTTPTNSLEGVEDVTFNTTATLSGYLPDAIYYCWFVPGTAYKAWTNHYKGFVNLDDFEQAFIQNILGNFLTFSDIYKKTSVAAESGDFI